METRPTVSTAGATAAARRPSSLSTEPGAPSAGEVAFAHFRQYAREKPEAVVLAALAVGFVLGWKLKPW